METYKRDPEIMTEAQVSVYLEVPAITLKHWRYRGKGPPYIKVQRLVRYRLSDLRLWMDRNSRTPGGRHAKAKA